MIQIFKHSQQLKIMNKEEKESVSAGANKSRVAEVEEAAAEYMRLAVQKAMDAKLQADYANRDQLPDHQRHALELCAVGKMEEAIASVHTDASNQEAAGRHLFLAELLIDASRFDEAEQHYLKAVTIFPSYDNHLAAGHFYASLSHPFFPSRHQCLKALQYYKRCLSLAGSPEQKARVLNKLGRLHNDLHKYTKALKSYKKALKIYRQLAEEDPQAYLPYAVKVFDHLVSFHRVHNAFSKVWKTSEEVLRTYRQLAEGNPQAYLPNVAKALTDLAFFYLCERPNQKWSLRYANEAIEVLGKCNDTPFVRNQLKNAKEMIEQWNQKQQL